MKPQTAVNTELLRQFAESLGKDTHTVLFGLAATSKTPIELYNAFSNIANLRNIKSSQWKIEESENHFLNRKLPGHVNVSEDAQNYAKVMLTDSSIVDNNSNPQYLLESLFYIVSAKNVSLGDKKRILRDLCSVNAPLGNKDYQAYELGSSFWNQVDGSWIYPDGEQSKKPNPVVTAVKDALDSRKHHEEQIKKLSAQITDLKQMLSITNARADRSENNNERLQGDLALAQAEKRELERQLREAQRRQQPRTEPFGEQAGKEWDKAHSAAQHPPITPADTTTPPPTKPSSKEKKPEGEDKEPSLSEQLQALLRGLPSLQPTTGTGTAATTSEAGENKQELTQEEQDRLNELNEFFGEESTDTNQENNPKP